MDDAASHGPEAQRAIEGAAMWYARLLPGAADLDDPKTLQSAFARWLAADPRHAQAWNIVQTMGERMAHVPPGIALPTLDPAHHRPRRRAALGMLAVAAVGGGALVGWRQQPWIAWRVDHATAPGERRRVTLVDGSLLDLDTRTALDVDYGVAERAIHLRAGVILVSTRPDAAGAARPFVVHTAHSRILALGTRFEVRVQADATAVSVLEDAVLVSRAGSVDGQIRVRAGERLRLSRAQETPAVEMAVVGAGAWTTGQLVVWDRPLGEVAAELARYRRGWLVCDPAVAQLRISGVLPIDDTDQALDALQDSFPIQIERQWAGLRTRIGPRQR